MPFDDQDLGLRFDREHIWHPYAELPSNEPRYRVSGCEGVYLELGDGRRLIDGTASWWTAILGYRHPALMHAAEAQLQRMPHVMFGGLTHEPAIRLAERLLAIAPAGLEHVFFCDSGSVSVEVAMKMALQYWFAKGDTRRRRFFTLRGGYHGDTLGAMSLCDPDTGMHRAFSGMLAPALFAPKLKSRYGEPADPAELTAIEQLIAASAHELCAVLVEPIAQNAGGLRFYSAEILALLRQLCDEHGVLLILDEIATGFGRTGTLFACEHAGVSPDILCVGKALTGGVVSLAATLARRSVAETIRSGPSPAFMHGPTYMANPLACAVAGALIDTLLASNWQARVGAIAAQLAAELEPCRRSPGVADVRVLGAIGVVEMTEPIDVARVVPELVARGIWLRPFGRYLYTMPPFVISERELSGVTTAMREICELASTAAAPRS